MNTADENSGASLLKAGFWRTQLIRLANLFVASIAASVIFIFLYPDQVALVAAMGGILGVTLALGPRSWQADGAFPWRRLVIGLAILDGLAALLGRLAAVFSSVASPLDNVLLGVFGASALVMSIGAVPLLTQLFPRPESARDARKAAAREPQA